MSNTRFMYLNYDILGQLLALPYTYSSSSKPSGGLRKEFALIEGVRMKRKHVWTKDYMAPAPQLDESTTVLGCKSAEVKHKQKSRRGKSCSTRMMIYDESKRVRRHGAVQQLQPYDCDASESILIGSG